MKIEVIYSTNIQTKLHLRVDGAVNEECNTDQIEDKTIRPLGEFICGLGGSVYPEDLCERCFGDPIDW